MYKRVNVRPIFSMQNEIPHFVGHFAKFIVENLNRLVG